MTRLLLALLLGALACAGYPRTPEDLRNLADDIENQKSDLEQAVDTWGSGDVASSFTAYLDGDDVATIEEHMARGTTGRSIIRYYFFDGALFCYRENRTNSDSTVVQIEVLFDQAGNVLTSRQTQNGSPTSLDAYIVAMAKKHAQTLRNLTAAAPHVPEE